MEQTNTAFTKLNEGWNAEPGAPYPEVRVSQRTLSLTFYLNSWVFQGFKLGDVGELTFAECWRYRLGPPDEDQWHRGRCRFFRRVPEWGEFYEVTGDLRLDRLPVDSWTIVADEPNIGTRHFLFYFKDETFECDATEWKFKVLPAAEDAAAEWECVRLSSGSSTTLIPPRSNSRRRQAAPSGIAVPGTPTTRLVSFLNRLAHRLLLLFERSLLP